MNDRAPIGNFRFGRFVLQPGERRLLADDAVVPLEPRAFDLLTALAERAGELVTKDTLLEKVWPGRVVEESNLHVQISALRRALGKDVIATVAGSGYRFIARVDREDGWMAAAGSPEPAAAGHAHNLPRLLDSFIGREDDLQRLGTELRHSRLVTLAGIGGGGKTRLAIKLGERILPSFADGVRFVDLATVAEPERVALAVAAAVGVREEGDKPIEETLIRHLASQRLLLILDNCEHLMEACATLARRLLAATPDVRVIATSRERLGIPGESIFSVRPLTLPPPGARPDPAALKGFEAVRLFVERAQRVAPEFVLSADNAAAVAEICQQLDGIPLALELAAARVMLLSVEQIRARLGQRFRLLIGSSRSVSRHQTLLATIESSYESLIGEERLSLQHLSVFAGGWTLEAATAVASQGDDIEMTQWLGHLVEKSFVQVDRTGTDGPRYRMLETVRLYAHDILEESGAGGATRTRHLAHFLGFAKTAQSHLFGDAIRTWLERLDMELPNLLAAHAWCAHAADGAMLGLELATNLRTYWLARGLFTDGQRVYDEALARPGGEPRAMLRGRTLYALGQHQYARGQLRDVLKPALQALSIAREHGDDEWAVYCLDKICMVYGWLGETDRARECADEQLLIANGTGNQRLVGFALTAVGGVCRAQGDFEAAAAAYERALALFDEVRDVNNRHNALVNVARVSIARGILPRAREALVGAILLVKETGTTYRGHFALEAASRLAAASGDWILAARLQGASDVAVDKVGGTRTWYDDPILKALHEKPAAMLGAVAYAGAYESGRAATLEAALEEAGGWLRVKWPLS